MLNVVREPEHPEPAELRVVVVDHQVEHEGRAQVQAEHGRLREDADVPVEPHAVDEKVVLPVEVDAVEAPDAPVSAPFDAEGARGREPLQDRAGQPHEDGDEGDDEHDIDVVFEQLLDGPSHHVSVEVHEQDDQQDDELREEPLDVAPGHHRIDDDVRGPRDRHRQQFLQMLPGEHRRQDDELEADEAGEDVQRVVVPVQCEVVHRVGVDDEFEDDQKVQNETEPLTPDRIIVCRCH